MYFNKFPLVYNVIANARNLLKINVKSETHSVVLIHLTRYFKSSAKQNEHKYTKEDELIILKTINQSEFSTLSRYAVSKAKAKNIIRSRDVNGKFESLYDVVMAAELSEKLTEKFFDSIMSEELESPSSSPQEDTSSNTSDPYYKKLRGKFLNPALDDKIKSVRHTFKKLERTSFVSCLQRICDEFSPIMLSLTKVI